MFQPRSLRERLTLFLLLPLGGLLLAMGFTGFLYARENLMEQWREAAVLKLERAAGQVDNRLGLIKHWMEFYGMAESDDDSGLSRDWILGKMRELEPVSKVNLTWLRDAGRDQHGDPMHGEDSSGEGMHRVGFHGTIIQEVTPPTYDLTGEHMTVSLISYLNGKNGERVAKLEVVVHFDSLISDVVRSSWWQSNSALIVENNGKVLACTLGHKREALGDNNDPLELATLAALKSTPSGAIFGAGYPPEEVSGFYRLKEAPWSLVLFAPGREVLSPVIRFRTHFLLGGLAFVVAVLLLIRLSTRGTINSINEVSRAAQAIARGHYEPVLPVAGRCEIGELQRSFNSMVLQLEQGARLKQSMDLAKEVQQSLIPGNPPDMPGLDIAAAGMYCEATGGDYYDFMDFPALGPGRIGIAVGDVVGHGISAALMMTTARALLRGRLSHPGTLSQVVEDVNGLLCLDTARTYSFVTLFLMVIDAQNRRMQWVRAGHDPAVLYSPDADSFEELQGKGMALGVEFQYPFEECSYESLRDGQIILIGTDGIWETQNARSEMFGKDRTRDILRACRDCSASEIVQAVADELSRFRQDAPQEDDVTLVVVKLKPGEDFGKEGRGGS